MSRTTVRFILLAALAISILAAVSETPGAESAPVDTELAWTELAADRPLFGQVALYDAPADRMLLYGGEFDVNEPPVEERQLVLRLGAWSAFEPEGEGPQSRTGGVVRGGSAVLDEAERVAVVACDCTNGGTHLLDLASDAWQPAPNGGEHSRSNVLLAYDPVGDQAILYGGYEHSLSPILSDGMAYDMSEDRAGWRELPDAPFQVTDQAVAYVPAARHVLAFGGRDSTGLATAQLWRLDVARLSEDDAWADISEFVSGGATPSPRMGATLTVDPESSVAVMVGGYSQDGDRADSWLLDYADPDQPEWLALDAGSGPAARAGHSAVWDQRRGRVIVYGGVSSGGDLNVWDDTWALVDASSLSQPAFVPVAKRGTR